MWKLEYLSLDFKPKTSKKLGNNPSSVPEALSMSPFYVITLFSVSQYFFLLATAEVLFLPNSGCGHFFESSSSAPESSSHMDMQAAQNEQFPSVDFYNSNNFC